MKRVIFIVSLMISIGTANAQVIVTPPATGNVDMCVGGAYKTIPDFKVAEKQNTDFNASSSLQTYELNAPSNFEFNPGVGSITTPSSTDISFAYLNVTATKITLNYFLNATAKKDSFIFKNIQVRAVGNNSSSDLRYTGGSASQNQNNTNQNVHAHFNSNQAYVNLNASQKVVCANASDINLNGSPGGGSYSGSSAIAGNNFKPSASGSGTFVITYTASQNGCSGTDTVHITVRAIPSVTFFGLGSSYCSADTSLVSLTGFPSGGTFSGSGIVNSNFFKPSNAGTGNNKSVTYSYTSNNCTATSTLNTNINPSPTGVTISLVPSRNSYIDKEDSILITGTQNNITIPSQGTEVVTGNGVILGTDGKYRFFPNVVGSGEYNIIRTVTRTSNGCKSSESEKITVNASIAGIISGLGSSYCKSSNDVQINVNNDVGTYKVYFKNVTNIFYQLVSVNSPIVDANQNDGQAIFKPSMADIGDYLIEFTGQTTGVISANVRIEPAPIVSVSIKNKFCSNEPDIAIPYSAPVGGITTFSGIGVSNGNFSPDGLKGNDTIYYQYLQASNGCKANGYVVTTIFDSPQNVFFSGLNNKYCSSDPYAILSPNPLISPAGKGSFYSDGGGLQLDNINQTIFLPSTIGPTNLSSKNYTITYTYTTNDGCSERFDSTTVVNSVPEVNLTGLNNAYCLNISEVNLSGNPSANGVGSFSIQSALPTANLLENNKLRIGKATAGTYYLTYTFKDNTSQCTSFDTDTTIIRNIPVVSFSNLDASYCMSNKNIPLYGSPSGNKGIFSSSTADVSGITKSLDITKSGVGEHTIKYTFTDEFGCTSSDSMKTVIYDSPSNLNIKLSSTCEKDTIKFSDNNSTLISKVGAVSFIKTAVWKIDTTTFIKSFGEIPKTVLNSGTHKVNYTLTTDKECFTSFDKDITIGSYPKTSFTWDEICNNEDTKFKNTTPLLDVGIVNKVVWDFSDPLKPGKISINVNNSIKGDTSHTYKTPVSYKVFLTAYSDYNCIALDTHNIFILESKIIKKTEPYSNDFDDLISDWVPAPAVEFIPSSWDLGIPNKKHIHSTNGAWVTSLTKSFNPDEQSYVYSPCFTIDESITKPMIHLDVWSRTNLNSSGANLQYSRNGRDWNTLGKRNASGVNWYNNTGNIASRPAGAQLDQDGWTDTMQSWKNARHVFDNELGESKNIRFRISFAGNKDTTEGFAFDNVWIGDRTRLILTEHFTNNSSLNTFKENNHINDLVTANLVDNNPKDIIKLEYHTTFPGFDPINNRNIPDPGARALYYGVKQIPYTSVDGSYYSGNTLGITQKTIDTRSLYDPAFELVLNPIVTNTAVSGHVEITNKIPVKNSVTVYISLLERYVNNIPGKSEESTYQWVHSKFLPDAAGTSFKSEWWQGQPMQKVNLFWTIPAGYIYDDKKVAMIAFVQDNVTKEIYQAAYKPIGATVITNTFEPNEATSTVSLYPNPANDVTTVVLNGKLKGSYSWLIFDELGRVVGDGLLQDGTEGFTINTQNYASGFYTLRLSNSSDGVKTQKFVVVH